MRTGNVNGLLGLFLTEGCATMKAAYIDRVGPPENIHFGELRPPAIGPSDVLVKTTGVCVDPVDTLIRTGQLPEQLSFPFIVGRDLAGVVRAVGPGVRRFVPGDRVWCLCATAP
jgi:NADPH:quinone reductase-like Zn-dependent oxidoreductase